MYRFTRNYCRFLVYGVVGVSFLFLGWQLGTLVGNKGVLFQLKANKPSGMPARKSIVDIEDVNDSKDFISSLEEDQNKHRSSTSKVLENSSGSTQSKNRVFKSNVKEPRNIPTKRMKTSLTTSPTTPTKTTTALSPITLQYSWAEVYGETGCSPNPWRTTLVELFAEWVKMAKKYNLEYILFCGTLLGALRTGDAIPYDSDIDLLMDVKYFPKMKEISVKRDFDYGDGKIRFVVQPEFDHNVSSNARKRYTCKGELTPNMVDQCSFQEPFGRLIKKNLHIDFYQFYDKGSTLEDPSEDDLKTYDKSDMFPLRPCKFMGMDSYCPYKPWKLLKKYFHTDNLDSKYKCKNKRWVDKNGRSAF